MITISQPVLMMIYRYYCVDRSILWTQMDREKKRWSDIFSMAVAIWYCIYLSD